MEPPAFSGPEFELPPDFDLRFPALPKSVSDVSSMLMGPHEAPDPNELAAIVATDPILVIALLRRINSVYYSLRRPVDDVRQAVRLLGYKEVHRVTVAASLMQMQEVFPSEEQAFVFQEIMKVSVSAAYFAQYLAAQLQLPNQQKAYLAGLQHALGRFVLLYNRPHQYADLWKRTIDDFGPRAGDEWMVFGVDHAVLGAQAMRRWNLPESLAGIVRYYLRPGFLPGADQRLALTVGTAVDAAEQLCLSLPSTMERPTQVIQRFFRPAGVVSALARHAGVPPKTLTRWIEDQYVHACEYIEAMVPPASSPP